MLSASSLRPKSTCREPIVSQLMVVWLCSAARCNPLALMNTSVRTKPVTIAPMETSELNTLLRKVNSVMNTADSSGRNKMIQGSDSNFIASKLHRGQIFNVRGLPTTIKRHDERQTDRDFGRRHRDDEKHQHLAVEFVVEPRKRDKCQISRVEHQLQRHINHQQVTAHDDAKQPQRKQQEADDQIMMEANVHFIRVSFCSGESHRSSPPAAAPRRLQMAMCIA